MAGPDVSLERDPDVVIVGAGVVGCASAYFLAGQGDRVVVLDHGKVGMGASFGNAGQLTPGDAIPLAAPGVVGQALRWAVRPNSPFSMDVRLTPSYLSWLVAFARWSHRSIDARVDGLRALAGLSLDLVEEMPEEEKDGFGFRREGILNLYQTRNGLRSGLKDAETLERHGVRLDVLDGAQARVRSGFDGELAGGVLFPADAHCSPAAYVRYLASSARQRGVAIHEGVGVDSLDRLADGRIAVRTKAGTVTPKAVVLAAGVGIPALIRSLGVKVPIVGGGGYSVDVELARKPRLPLLFHERRLAATAIEGRTRIAGLMAIGKRNCSISGRKASYLLRSAKRTFGEDNLLGARPVWAGLRPCTPDGLPIVSRVPGCPDVIVAGGHAMVGMTLGAGTGRVVADLVRGAPPAIDLAPFDLGRFK